MPEKGVLYLVATPIGNLEDISSRALKVLREVDLIAAEDTRQTIKLLNHFDIKTPMTSYHEHNKNQKGDYILERLEQGESVAVVTDAGTPGISDPGEDIVKAAVERGITVTAIPGPVAAISALIVSGLSTGRFVFEGFLPKKNKEKEERIIALKEEPRTIVLYESPHKLKSTLLLLRKYLGNRKIAVAREMTKKFEEIMRGTLDSVIETYESRDPKGEYVLVIEGACEKTLKAETNRKWDEVDILEHMSIYTGEGLTKKEAIKKVAADRGISKREVYAMLIKDKED